MSITKLFTNATGALVTGIGSPIAFSAKEGIPMYHSTNTLPEQIRSRSLIKPEAVGMSSARLARLDEVMQRRYVDSGYLPGVLTYVYRGGQLVHTGIYAGRWT
jgi:hypothetical protein